MIANAAFTIRDLAGISTTRRQCPDSPRSSHHLAEQAQCVRRSAPERGRTGGGRWPAMPVGRPADGELAPGAADRLCVAGAGIADIPGADGAWMGLLPIALAPVVAAEPVTAWSRCLQPRLRPGMASRTGGAGLHSAKQPFEHRGPLDSKTRVSWRLPVRHRRRANG